MGSHRRGRSSRVNRARLQRSRRPLGALEELESRVVLSGVAHPLLARPDIAPVPPPSGGPLNLPPYTPVAIRNAYGYSQIQLLNPATGKEITGDGTGQTIAIVDAYDNPNLPSNLATFDQDFNLPTANLVKIDEYGNPVTTQVPQSTSWGLEESLDVEWAHALAPGATILLVEAQSAYNNDLYLADQEAAYYTGGIVTQRANVISNSWGETEYASESATDHYFTTTDNHATFVFSAGDDGAPPIYPSASPDVLSVGGTTLTMTENTSGPVYSSESGWTVGSDDVPPYNNPYIGGGGGPSAYEKEPNYQLAYGLNLGARGTPDVALQADPLTGVYVLDTFGGGSSSGWWRVGGTSFSAPAWSALLTVVNQGRAYVGSTPMGASAQADLYNLQKADGYYSSSNPNGAFRDITTGNNGYPAGVGYDYVTGVGTPVANVLASWVVYSVGPGGSGSGGGGTLLGGGHGPHSSVIAAPVPENGSLISGVPASGQQLSAALPGQATLSLPVPATSGTAAPITLQAPANLAAAAESYRAFTAAPTGENDLGPTAIRAAAGPATSPTTTVLQPEALTPSAIILPSEEATSSNWESPSNLVADAGTVATENPADLTLAAAMALAITGSWSALEPIETDRKQVPV